MLRTSTALVLVCWLLGAWTLPAEARSRRKRPASTDGMGAISGPLPGPSSTRSGLRVPPPISIRGTRTGDSWEPTRRRSLTRMKASSPHRQKARREAVEALRGRGGSTRVAILASSSIGVGGEEAALVLASRSSVGTLQRLIRSRDSKVRLGVARALAFRKRFGPVLIQELLRDRSLRVLRVAVRTAAGFGDKRSVGALAQLALRYDRGIRGIALQSLARFSRIPVAKGTVIRALTHSSATIRVDAVVAVGLARANWAAYWLGRLIQDPAPSVRRSVARALGRLDDSAASRTALSRLRRDRSSVIRKEARESLAKLAQRRRASRRAARHARRRHRRR